MIQRGGQHRFVRCALRDEQEEERFERLPPKRPTSNSSRHADVALGAVAEVCWFVERI